MRYFDPGEEKKEDGLTSIWKSFVGLFKEGRQKKYKWGPFEMAAIMRKVEMEGSLMEAE